ncbi:ribonuclease H [Sesbania bispinosa]|nr:ribonuclease H [Sesbania bispinosa]
MGQNLDYCTCWILGDSLTTRFWKDIFVPNCGHRCDHNLATLPAGMEDLPVASFVTYGSWNWELITSHLSTEIQQHLAYIKPPAPDEGRDFLAWKFSTYGEFTIKYAYDFLLSVSNIPQQEDEIFKLICERDKRGMTQDDICPRCNCNKETLIHASRDCECVDELWESLINHNDWASFFSLGQEQWIIKYLEFSGNVLAGVAWSFLFPVGIWLIWKDKNSLVFQQKTDLPGNLFFHIVSYAKRIIEVVYAPKPIAQRIFRK